MEFKINVKRLLSVVLFTFVPVLGHAATYYVSKTGNNNNSCAQSQAVGAAKLTIAAGLSCLSAGDVLIIEAGTYTEGIENPVSGVNDSMRTVIRGETGATVILNGATSIFDIVSLYGRSYITIDNLTLNATPSAMNFCLRLGTGGFPVDHILFQNSVCNGNRVNYGGTFEQDGSYNNTIRNVEVYGAGFVWQDGAQPHGHGVYVKGNGSVIENCNIHDNDSHGVHLYNGTSTTNGIIVRNNRIHDNGSFGMTFSSGSDNIAYNNLIYRNSSRTAAGGFRFYDGAVNNQFINNTVYGNSGYGIWVQGGSGSIVKNNISYGNTAADYVDASTGTIESSDLFGVNPLFINAASGDFHLGSSSAAIDKAISLNSLFGTDFDGTPRPQGNGWDLGALELGGGSSSGSSSTTQVSAPLNLRVLSAQ